MRLEAMRSKQDLNQIKVSELPIQSEDIEAMVTEGRVYANWQVGEISITVTRPNSIRFNLDVIFRFRNNYSNEYPHANYSWNGYEHKTQVGLTAIFNRIIVKAAGYIL